MTNREVVEEAKRILKVIIGHRTMHRIDLRMEPTDTGIKILGVPFVIYPGDGKLRLKPSSPRGVIATHLSRLVKSNLKKRKISFLTLDGELYISLPDYALALTTMKPSPKNEHGRLMLRPPGAISPTVLLSPYAFDILDVLFRLKELELGTFECANRFAHEFNLNQPKLSLMMTAFRATNLLELRNKVRDISPDWWRHALDYPAVRKRLTPFFQAAKPYYSRAFKKREALDVKITSGLPSPLILGPPELLKAAGLIRDPSFYFWVEPEQEKTLKKRCSLIPGSHPDYPTWHLALPARSPKQEAIVSSVTRHTLRAGKNANLFRALWDLSYGDERLREVQMDFLRMILKSEGRIERAKI